MNTELIREQMKVQVTIENKNVSGLHKWINDMVAGLVFTMTFLQVLQNYEISNRNQFVYTYFMSNNYCYTTNDHMMNCYSTKKKKINSRKD